MTEENVTKIDSLYSVVDKCIGIYFDFKGFPPLYDLILGAEPGQEVREFIFWQSNLNDEMVVTIRGDGSVEYGPGFKGDEAAEFFYRQFGAYMREQMLNAMHEALIKSRSANVRSVAEVIKVISET